MEQIANKKANVKTNYVLNLIYQIVTIIMPVITIPYLTRTIGADGIGRVSYIESIVSYFMLFAAFGIATFAQREISYNHNSKEKCSVIFWENIIRSIFTTGIVCLFYIPLLIVEKEIMYFIFLITIINVIFDITWFFQGLEEFRQIFVYGVLTKVAQIVLIFVLIKGKNDTYIYVWILCLGTLARSLLLFPSLRKRLVKIHRKDLKPFTNFKTIFFLFLPTIAVQLYTILDKTMIGLITNDDFQNGYYELALRIVKLSTTVITSLGTVMSPRIASCISNDDMDKAVNYMYKSYRFVWFLGIPMCLGLFFVSHNFVSWYFGDGYDDVVILMKILSFLTIIIGCSNVSAVQFLIPIKKEKVFTIVAFSAAALNIVTNLILIYFFAAIGAAIATIIAESFITIVLFIYLRKYMKLTEIFKTSIKYLIAGAIMSIALFFEDYYFTPSILNTFVIIICGITIYFLFLFILRDEFLFENMKKVFNYFRRKKS